MNKILSVIAIMIFIVSCATMIKSSNTIGDFKVSVTSFENNNGDLVRISGKNIDSALWIKSYELTYKENKVFIKIYKSLEKTGYSGPYDIQFYIPNSVKFIILGDNEVVWKR